MQKIIQRNIELNLEKWKKETKNIDQENKRNALHNIEMLYKARNEVIKFYDDCSLMVSKAKTKAAKGTGLKILTPKQMLQRLLTALPRVKAANNSESLLNEKFKSKIFILCISQNESLKKYTT